MASLDTLFAAAAEARAKAYAPYSKFSVGAAILGSDGRIHAGANVENAAYPQGNCAEASAIAAMIMAGCHEIVEVAVVGGPMGKAEILCPPCGGCRQRLREFGGLTAKVHLRDPALKVTTMTVDQLLPVSFGPEHL